MNRHQDNEKIADGVHEVFREVLNLDQSFELGSLKYGESEEFDSLAFMEIVVNLELILGISFEADKLNSLRTIQDFVNYVLQTKN